MDFSKPKGGAAVRIGAFKPVTGAGLEGDAWCVRHAGPALQHGPSLFVVGNGFIGARGLAEEANESAALYLNAVYERVPIRYHESAHGFAKVSDTRLPAANTLRWAVEVEGERFTGPAPGADQEWLLDLRTGVVRRSVCWRLQSGREIALTFERLASLEQPALLAHRVRVGPREGAAAVRLDTWLDPPRVQVPAEGEVYDPRLGPALEHDPWTLERWLRPAEPGRAGRVDRLRNSGFRVASACAAVGARQGAEGEALHWRFAGEAHAEAPFEALKLTAYASDRGDPARDPAGAVTEALEWGAGRSFDALVETQRRALDAYWEAAQVALPAHPALERAARYNLLQLFQAVGRDGESSIPAKGQTGEGYEGHVFWDADCFMLPMFAFLAPDRARSMLEFRSKGLDKARAIARLMGHARGALFPWRTIGGEECSAFFPAGTAQYHINADIAYAVRIYAAATGDEALLDAFGVELLLETARIWLEIGHHRADGQFCIDKVTGPDEYSALVDNNYYTNAMAKAHLEDAVRQAEAMAARAPQAFQALAARIRYTAPEGEEMRRAARAMRLPVCAERGVLAQDDAFLSKQVWDFAGTPPERYPLLLHHHPLTIYRRQVCKQADAVLALALAGRGLDPELKRRTFAYYEGVTTHDSTLSPSGFATAAAQAGLLDQAFAYLRMTTLVDLEDLCGNADHGLHMAAMAGGWLALAFGFAGVDVEGGTLALTPRFGAALGPYGLRLRYRGRLLSLEVSREGVVYRLEQGEALEITHLGAPLLLQPGRAAAAELAP